MSITGGVLVINQKILHSVLKDEVAMQTRQINYIQILETVIPNLYFH